LQPHVAVGQRVDDRVRIELKHLGSRRNVVLDGICVAYGTERLEQLLAVGRLRTGRRSNCREA